MNIDSFSIEGKYYSNEDSLSFKTFANDTAIVVLADGMGGLSFGKEASDLVVNTITEFVSDNVDNLPAKEMLFKSLEYADVAIAQKSIEYHSKMGAAIALAFITGNQVHYTWLGNVRIYLVKPNYIEQLTTDHVLDVGYGKFLLTRCIKGGGLREELPYHNIKANAGDTLVLCTDGLYKQINNSQLIEINSNIEEQFEDDASMIRIDF